MLSIPIPVFSNAIAIVSVIWNGPTIRLLEQKANG